MRLAKIKKGYLVAAAALAMGAMICLPRFASAAVTGVCSNCHTMHNSQDDKPMTFSAGFGTTGGSTTPNNNLLRGNCLQCHTGTNNGLNTIPYVYSGSSAPTYGTDTLAGGNFYWCVNGGTTGEDPVAAGGGHNVDMLGVTAGPLTSPPGYTDSTTWSTRETNEGLASTSHLTCAGTAGCHGDRTATDNFSAVHGAHHTDPGGAKDGTTVAKSFRFLSGVTGTEVGDWEYAATDSSHNEYKGAARTADSALDNTTISSLCAQCHGAFHNSSVASYTNANGATVTAGIQGTAWGSPWIRHPTDFDMNTKASTTEYAAYTAYDPMVPVGHSTLTASTIDSVAYGNTNGAIVMCISCHRAHGSPYADLLRWDYSTMVAGTTAPTVKGCFTCHTTKD